MGWSQSFYVSQRKKERTACKLARSEGGGGGGGGGWGEGVQFSRDSFRAFHDRRKIGERGLLAV